MKEKIPVNHSCFEVAAADILARAYEQFPATITVDGREDYRLLRSREIMPCHCDEINGNYAPVMITTAKFLEREGLIHFSSCNKWIAEHVTLTSKGFILLREPESLTQTPDTNEPFGEKIRKVASQAGSTALSSTISSLIKNLL